jgi:hypothetical protein
MTTRHWDKMDVNSVLRQRCIVVVGGQNKRCIDEPYRNDSAEGNLCKRAPKLKTDFENKLMSSTHFNMNQMCHPWIKTPCDQPSMYWNGFPTKPNASWRNLVKKRDRRCTNTSSISTA